MRLSDNTALLFLLSALYSLLKNPGRLKGYKCKLQQTCAAHITAALRLQQLAEHNDAPSDQGIKCD